MSSGANATWKVVLVFAGIFVAGGVTGGFAALRLARSYVQQRATPDHFPRVHMIRLNEKLNLTDTQKERVGAIVGVAGEELRNLKRETEKCFATMNAKIMAELTPEQKLEFEEMQRRFRERMKNRPMGPRPDRPDRDPAKWEERRGQPMPSSSITPVSTEKNREGRE